MTDIAGRLAGVAVLVLARPFLRGYIIAVLRDAGATVLIAPVIDEDVADVTGATRPAIACIEADALQEFDVLMPSLESHGIPCLMMLAARLRADPLDDRPGSTLRQPFAGFQIVDALDHLIR